MASRACPIRKSRKKSRKQEICQNVHMFVWQKKGNRCRLAELTNWPTAEGSPKQ
ncbi:MAG: hypothetical protein IPH88_14895 [Bacteroidales bacterium]|nr:hypothetical protein [Bacteroidales bacterium]